MRPSAYAIAEYPPGGRHIGGRGMIGKCNSSIYSCRTPPAVVMIRAKWKAKEVQRPLVEPQVTEESLAARLGCPAVLLSAVAKSNLL